MFSSIVSRLELLFNVNKTHWTTKDVYFSLKQGSVTQTGPGGSQVNTKICYSQRAFKSIQGFPHFVYIVRLLDIPSPENIIPLTTTGTGADVWYSHWFRCSCISVTLTVYMVCDSNQHQEASTCSACRKVVPLLCLQCRVWLHRLIFFPRLHTSEWTSGSEASGLNWLWTKTVCALKHRTHVLQSRNLVLKPLQTWRKNKQQETKVSWNSRFWAAFSGNMTKMRKDLRDGTK